MVKKEMTKLVKDYQKHDVVVVVVVVRDSPI